MISEGFSGGGESCSARKAHLRSIRSGEILEILALSKLPWLDATITFSDSDMEGCQHPHDDSLVIRVVVANKIEHKVLVENGISADMIFASVFDKMGIEREKLEPSGTPSLRELCVTWELVLISCPYPYLDAWDSVKLAQPQSYSS